MCDATPAAELRLSLEPNAVATARRFLRDCACPIHHPPTSDAELVVSELVTNGIRHGAPPITLNVECEGALGTRILVSDRGPASPQHLSPDEGAHGGRGIMLVDYISQMWGVTQTAEGKSVWALL